MGQSEPGGGCAPAFYAVSPGVSAEEPAHYASGDAGACQGDCGRRGAALRLYRKCAWASFAEHVLPQVQAPFGGARRVHCEPNADSKQLLPVLPASDPGCLACIGG